MTDNSFASDQKLDLEKGQVEHACQVRLFQVLSTRFEKEDLNILCFRLGINYDDLPAADKKGKTIALIRHLNTRSRISELIEIGVQDRPDIDWRDIFKTVATTSPEQLLSKDDDFSVSRGVSPEPKDDILNINGEAQPKPKDDGASVSEEASSDPRDSNLSTSDENQSELKTSLTRSLNDALLPLSIVPRTYLPLLNHSLIGREYDFAWLCDGVGDRLLVGLPGSGKTFLLYKLALDGHGLFVVSENRQEIAAAILSEQPSVLIVDDAHIHQETLQDLKQIRKATGAEFSILASCWAGAQATVSQIFNLPDSRIYHLSLLTRDEIVKVIKATGVQGSSGLIHEIVNQADGRPGVAAILAHLCLQDDVQKVISGNVLTGLILKVFEPLGKQRINAILAALSIGGDSGMAMEIVANELRLNLVEVWESVTQLAAGDVISKTGAYLSVHPAALRHALVRDVFFQGALSLPIERLLARAPSLSDTAHTLIGARARDAIVPQNLLVQVLEQAHSTNAWEEYVWLGSNEARWTLENHPEMIISIARPALRRASEHAIPLLLKAAIGDQRPLHSTPEHPLRLMEDWVYSGPPGTGQALERREILFRSAQDWLISGYDVQVGLGALQLALSPKFADYTIDPGLGNEVTVRHGYISMDEVLAIQSLWSNTLEIISAVEITNWNTIRKMVEAWAYPGRINVTISDEMYHAMRSFAGQMLRDVISLAKDHPGVLHWASQTVVNLNIDIKVPLDSEFETLYPVRDSKNWRAAEKQQGLAVQELASVWSKLAPEQVARRIVSIEHEAQLVGINWPRWTPYLCSELAQNVESPNAWTRAMIDNDAASDLVVRFLHRAAKANEPGWIELAFICLERPSLRGVTISLTLSQSNPPKDLLDQVLQNLEGYAPLVENLCFQNQVHEELMMQLLRHEDAAIVGAAAIGEWHAEPKGSVRDSLQKHWYEAIKSSAIDDYWLGEVFKSNPSLAYDWLQNRITQAPSERLPEEIVETAVSELDTDAKRRILRQLPPTYNMVELVECLIDKDIVLYSELLNDERLKRFHLVPLSGHPEGIWIEKAKLALDAGFNVEEIVGAACTPHKTIWYSGNESDRWAKWVDYFEQLCSNEDERIQKIGEVGQAYAKARQDEALKQEQRESIYGWP